MRRVAVKGRTPASGQGAVEGMEYKKVGARQPVSANCAAHCPALFAPAGSPYFSMRPCRPARCPETSTPTRNQTRSGCFAAADRARAPWPHPGQGSSSATRRNGSGGASSSGAATSLVRARLPKLACAPCARPGTVRCPGARAKERGVTPRPGRGAPRPRRPGPRTRSAHSAWASRPARSASGRPGPPAPQSPPGGASRPVVLRRGRGGWRRVSQGQSKSRRPQISHRPRGRNS